METDATPIVLDVGAEVTDAVRGWVETLGWQVIDPDAADLVPPVLTLTDAQGRTDPEGTPSILLVGDRDDPAGTAVRAGAIRPRAVVRWPDERERLPEAARGVLAGSPHRATGRTLRIAAAAGGVGASTVALALAGLVAWRGPRTLVVVRGDVPSADARRVDAEVLQGAGAWRAGAPAPGVPRLRVVASSGPPPAAIDADEVDVAVVEVGTRDDADVLVLRRDAAGTDALARSTAGIAVVVDQGPVRPRDLLQTAAGRRVVTVPFSVRVARAGLARRVPAGLPGTWLRTLAPIVADS